MSLPHAWPVDQVVAEATRGDELRCYKTSVDVLVTSGTAHDHGVTLNPVSEMKIQSISCIVGAWP